MTEKDGEEMDREDENPEIPSFEEPKNVDQTSTIDVTSVSEPEVASQSETDLTPAPFIANEDKTFKSDAEDLFASSDDVAAPNLSSGLNDSAARDSTPAAGNGSESTNVKGDEPDKKVENPVKTETESPSPPTNKSSKRTRAGPKSSKLKRRSGSAPGPRETSPWRTATPPTRDKDSDSDNDSCAGFKPSTTQDDDDYPDSNMDNLYTYEVDDERKDKKDGSRFDPSDYCLNYDDGQKKPVKTKSNSGFSDGSLSPPKISPERKTSSRPNPEWSKKGGFSSKKRGLVDEDAVCLPLKNGWRRELVYRKTSDPGKSRQSDVYYFSPSGKKLRSMPNILGYMAENGITEFDERNFSFAKRSFMEPPFDVVRDALEGNWPKPSKAKTERSFVVEEKEKEKKKKKKKSMVLSPNSATAEMAQAYRQSDKISKENCKKNLDKDESFAWDNTPEQEQLGYLGLVPMKKNRKRSGGDSHSTSGPKSKKMKSSQEAGRSTPEQKTPPARPVSESPHLICSEACTDPAVKNVDPSLPCSVCRTLFHPLCVHFDPSSNISNQFVCQKCTSANNRSKTGSKPGPASSKKKTDKTPVSPSSSGKPAAAHIVEKDGTDVIIKINERLVKVPQNALVQTESGPKVMMTKKLLQQVMENSAQGESLNGSVISTPPSKPGPKSSKLQPKDDGSSETPKKSRPGPKSSKFRLTSGEDKRSVTPEVPASSASVTTEARPGPKSSKAGPKSSKRDFKENEDSIAPVAEPEKTKPGPKSSKSKAGPKSSKTI